MNIEDYISLPAIKKLKSEIEDAQGNEVFFIGTTNDKKIVDKISVVARGNEFEVPMVEELASRSDVVIHNHPSGQLKPSSNDLNIAHYLANFGVASYIVNNEVDDIFVIVEPLDKQGLVALNVEDIYRTLSPGGIVSQKLAGYEHRPQQLDMIKKVVEAFNQQKIAVIEAGTGVGKSLAYLIPAIYWATCNHERCVVSTNTINLQEQLIKKDIPFLKRALGLDFKAILVKGRGNYICLRKIQSLQSNQEMLIETGSQEELKQIIAWSKITKDGSKADLNFVPSAAIWELVNSESDNCLRSKCEYFKSCFVTRARREASQAQILVVNHHLLFSDLAVQSLGADVAILPKYHHLIFDEAHNIEDIATDYFGTGITRTGIARIIHRLHAEIENKRTGYLNLLVKKLASEANQHPLEELDQIITRIQTELIPRCDAIVEFSEDLMTAISELAVAMDSENQSEIRARLDKRIQNYPLWQVSIIPKVKNFLDLLNRFHSSVMSVLDKIETADIKFGKDFLYTVVDIQAQILRIKTLGDVIGKIILKSDQENVRWIEVEKKKTTRPIVRLKIAPLDISEMMNELVYKNFKTIIMTSATLTISGQTGHGEFDYLKHQIGLDLVEPSHLITAKIPAPFDYKTQAIIAIPLDIPAPDSPEFAPVISEAIFEALKISEGRAFVLFTSYRLLDKVYQTLEPRLSDLGIMSLKQGQQDRHRLLERFKLDKTSVLFGTDSFWQGVDVEGDALENVIITKLPFKVPSEPIIEARVEVIERRGGNAFMEYSVPQAVIKLKQGFGRLIRKKTDRGSVFIFDKRIIEKFYGRIFLHSLPASRIVQGPLKYVLEEVRQFFSAQRNQH